MRRIRKSIVAVVLGLLTALGLVAVPTSAAAAPGDIGHLGPAYNGSINSPTSDKPQSKLWHTDGIWFAAMFDTGSRTWRISRLDRATQTWVNTGVLVDDRPNTLADTLWDGSHLYIASHVVTISSDTTPRPSVPNSPARLMRYSYDSGQKTFRLDAGFPATITGNSSESMTIDKDSTGRIWATWTQVSGDATAGFTSAVYVNATNGSDNSWGTPFVMPTAGANPAPDDLSAVVAFGRNKIGILWSNQVDDTVYWAVHNDGAAVGDWRGAPAIRGNRQADDHLNLKAIVADQAGRVFAAVKTSADAVAGSTPSSPQILLLVFKPGTGAWSATTFGTLADCHTRPQLVLDEEHSRVHVVAAAPTGAGCPYSGAPGTIYEKSAPMDDPVFPSGRGTPIIREAASENMNDPTVTKQSVTGSSGLVVLAANTATKRYWHADLSLGGTPPPPPPPPTPAPTAAFTASPTSGAAPLAVQFTDTSTGSPTSWAWDFGDGSTATTQNPAHTYSAAGTYTATLRATNAAGTSAPATQTITVSAAPPPPPPPPPPPGGVTAGAVTTATSTAAVTGVTVNVPAGRLVERPAVGLPRDGRWSTRLRLLPRGHERRRRAGLLHLAALQRAEVERRDVGLPRREHHHPLRHGGHRRLRQHLLRRAVDGARGEHQHRGSDGHRRRRTRQLVDDGHTAHGVDRGVRGNGSPGHGAGDTEPGGRGRHGRADLDVVQGGGLRRLDAGTPPGVITHA